MTETRYENIEYTVIRSSRRTLALEVNERGVLVRAPRFSTKASIERFVQYNKGWIEKRLKKVEKRKAQLEEVGLLSDEEILSLKKQARKAIPEKVAFYAELVGVSYGQISIRCQKTRWGSCSAKGNLNFNCLLMLTPPEVLDSVVVHELCHRKEMNHSARFYAEVRRVFPEYDKWNRWLKENGPLLMARVPQD